MSWQPLKAILLMGICSLTELALPYLVAVFAVWDFDPQAWTPFARLVVAVFGLVFAAVPVYAYYDEDF